MLMSLLRFSEGCPSLCGFKLVIGRDELEGTIGNYQIFMHMPYA